ncbi:MAG TPA: glyoxalase/bleomycin resistance/extradiol dioxygenase family protein [Ferruginibacter sp.]|nr:glyoxalase/bleomycin resistance/extradiol dioxygenase family protein [Ferruginibacter sp.]
MKLTPYLMFSGNCEKALNFYADVFGGTITDLKRFEEGPPGSMGDVAPDKIMHARLSFDGNMIMASDGESQPVSADGIQLSVDFGDTGKMDNAFKKLSDGGAIIMDLQDTFWGARFGMLKDQFGFRWMFNCEIKK